LCLHNNRKNYINLPMNSARFPNSSSILSNWLYFANLSDLTDAFGDTYAHKPGVLLGASGDIYAYKSTVSLGALGDTHAHKPGVLLGALGDIYAHKPGVPLDALGNIYFLCSSSFPDLSGPRPFDGMVFPELISNRKYYKLNFSPKYRLRAMGLLIISCGVPLQMIHPSSII